MTDAHTRRRDELSEYLGAIYWAISKMLLALPITIRIAPMEGDTRASQLSAEVLRARELMIEMPGLDAGAVEVLDYVMLDFHTALAYLSHDMHNPQPWKLDVIDYAIARIAAGARVLEEDYGIVVLPDDEG